MLTIVILAGSQAQPLRRTLECLAGLSGLDYEIVVTQPRAGAAVPELLDQGDAPWSGRVRHLSLPAGARPGACLNGALRLARGGYLTFLQAGAVLDPVWLPGAVKALEQDRIAWCYTAARVRGTEDTLPPQDWPAVKTCGRIFPDIFAGGVSPQTAVIPRALLERLGGFDEDLSALVEEELLLRLSLTAPARFNRGALAEVEAPVRTDPGALVARCYWMSAFLLPLGRAGLKERALSQLLEDIEDADAWEAAGPYLEILSGDPEYAACLQAYLDRRNPQREPEPVETADVSGVKHCVGCGGCASICPEGAVAMAYREDGFLYPQVDGAACVSCGLCLRVCPTQYALSAAPIPSRCYALQAADAARMGASSGGVFPVLARHILDRGGYVAGAVFDEGFAVRHIVSRDPERVRAMQTSKYVQSDTSGVYSQIRDLLREGKTVLFTGCACQAAGLRAFLQKPYENLYTMDVVCHGVPSPQVYQSYLQEMERQEGPLAEVNFRRKEAFGWKTGLYLRFASGRTYQNAGDLYLAAFLSDWILRESCYRCAFKNGRYSDLTAADFWGIQYVDPQFEDGKGTSYLTVNTEKGRALFQAVRSEFPARKELGRAQTALAHRCNPSACSGVERPPLRELLLKSWREDPSSLNQAVVRAYQTLRFDVALILHWSPNFGNALTNYALYTYLAKNRRVIAVDNCGTLRPQGSFQEFARAHYVCSSGYFLSGDIKWVEQCSRALVVGSDQVWNRHFNRQSNSGNYYQLEFAGSQIRKVAYGASFGARGAEPEKACAPLYRRFHRIGVRERFGVESCRQLYGVKAEWVLDPVFLLDQAAYSQLAETSRRKRSRPFLLAYILNPTEEKRLACQRVREQLGGEEIDVIGLCEPVESSLELLRHMLDFAWVQPDAQVEDVLYFFQACRYVITDSFHGTCFSLIFQKNFMSFVNRQADRFSVFQELGDAAGHIGSSFSEAFFARCLTPPDYQAVNAVLDRERARSRRWLEEALH